MPGNLLKNGASVPILEKKPAYQLECEEFQKRFQAHVVEFFEKENLVQSDTLAVALAYCVTATSEIEKKAYTHNYVMASGRQDGVEAAAAIVINNCRAKFIYALGEAEPVTRTRES